MVLAAAPGAGMPRILYSSWHCRMLSARVLVHRVCKLICIAITMVGVLFYLQALDTMFNRCTYNYQDIYGLFRCKCYC